MAGTNDITIIAGIVTIFIFLAVLLPIINDSFGVDNQVSNFLKIQTDLASRIPNENNFSIIGLIFPVWVVDFGKVIISILLMFFWSFQVPVLMEVLLFLPMRIILVITVARNIWVGGGS